MSQRGSRSASSATRSRDGGGGPPKSGRRTSRNRPLATARVVIAGGAIALLIVALIVARTLRRSPTAPVDNGPVSPAVMQSLTTIPASIFAEYCPYCAAERWALVVALSRFGTFSGLHYSRSAADDVYPSTPTFTFTGSTYHSDYVDFAPVETQSNQRVNGSYAQLQTPTAEQQRLLQQYDAPPYVSSGATGSIPFVDFANQYVVSGATYNPDVLANRSWDEITASLHQPESDQAKAIVGSANALTAAICASTKNSPANVCGQPAIATIQGNLAKSPAPGGSQP
jgi:hypothetical protein